MVFIFQLSLLVDKPNDCLRIFLPFETFPETICQQAVLSAINTQAKPFDALRDKNFNGANYSFH